MNKKIVFAGAIVLLLAAGCSKKAAVQSNTSVTTQTDQQASQSTSLKELIAGGKPVKCDVTFRQDASLTSGGTVYFGNGNMRGDFTSTQSGHAAIVSHTIIKDKTIYTWTEGQASGYKMSQSNATTSPQQSQKFPEYEQKSTYNCQNWRTDDSMFNLPNTVTFSDFSAMMQQNTPPASAGAAASGSAGSNVSACAACNSLSGDSKTQCRAALKCQ